MRMLVIGLAALAGACASSSGVFARADGALQITTTATSSAGGLGTARGKAINEATAYCAKQGQKMVALETSDNSQFTEATSNLTFRCQ